MKTLAKWLAALVLLLACGPAFAQTSTPFGATAGSGLNFGAYKPDATNLAGWDVPWLYNGSSWGLPSADTSFRLGVNAPLTPNLVNPSVTYNIVATSGGTAYGAGQLICSSTTAATCSSGLPSFSLPLSGGRITGYHMRISDPTATAWPLNATIQIKEWSAQPALAAGDHATYALTTGTANWLGDFQCTSNGQEGDGSTWYCTPIGPVPELKGVGTVYVALVAMSGSGVIVTNTAETATLTPSIEQ